MLLSRLLRRRKNLAPFSAVLSRLVAHCFRYAKVIGAALHLDGLAVRSHFGKFEYGFCFSPKNPRIDFYQYFVCHGESPQHVVVRDIPQEMKREYPAADAGSEFIPYRDQTNPKRHQTATYRISNVGERSWIVQRAPRAHQKRHVYAYCVSPRRGWWLPAL
jgi:hypothetical protein